MDSLDVSSLFVTKAQATDFVVRLSAVIAKVYTNGFLLEKVLSEHFGLKDKDRLLKLFREHHISETVPTDVQGFLKKIQDTISALPVVTLTIAFEPRDETLTAFSEWFLLTLKKQVLFAVEIDNSLLAGAKITYKGKFKDYSLRQTFMTIMETQLHPQQAVVPPQKHDTPSTPSKPSESSHTIQPAQ